MRSTVSNTQGGVVTADSPPPHGLVFAGSCRDEHLGPVDLFFSETNRQQIFVARQSVWELHQTDLLHQYTKETCSLEPRLFTKLDRIVQRSSGQQRQVQLVFEISTDNLFQVLAKDELVLEKHLVQLTMFLVECLLQLESKNVYHPDISPHSVYIFQGEATPKFRLLSPYLYERFQTDYCSNTNQRAEVCRQGLRHNCRQIGELLLAVLTPDDRLRHPDLFAFINECCKGSLQSPSIIKEQAEHVLFLQQMPTAVRADQQNFAPTKQSSTMNLTKSQKCLRLIGSVSKAPSASKSVLFSDQTSNLLISHGDKKLPILQKSENPNKVDHNVLQQPEPVSSKIYPISPKAEVKSPEETSEAKPQAIPSGERKEPVRVFGNRLLLGPFVPDPPETYKLSPEVQSIVDKYSQGSPKNSTGSLSRSQISQGRVLQTSASNTNQILKGNGFTPTDSAIRVENDVLSNSGCSSANKYTSKYLERHRASSSLMGDSGISNSSVIVGSEVVRGLISPKGSRSQLIMTSSNYVLGDSPSKEDIRESHDTKPMYASSVAMQTSLGRAKLFTESTGQQESVSTLKQQMRESQESTTKEPQISWGKSYLENTGNRYRFAPSASVRNLASRTTDGSVIVPNYYSTFLKTQYASKPGPAEVKKIIDTDVVPHFNILNGQDAVGMLGARTSRRAGLPTIPATTYNLFEVNGTSLASIPPSPPKTSIQYPSSSGVTLIPRSTMESSGHKSRSVSFNLGAVHNTSAEMTPAQPKGILKNKKAVQTLSKAAEFERKYSTPYINH